MKFQLWILTVLISGLQTAAEKCLHFPEVEIKRHFYVDEYDLPLRIEVSRRTTHLLVSNIVRILLNEVLGYPHVYLISQDSANAGDNATRTLQKISTCETPSHCKEVDVLGPEVMINLEVWLVPGFNLEGWIATGEVEDCGPLGPIGRSGWFIAEYTVKYFWETKDTVIDHWRAFTNPEVVAHFDLSGEDVLINFNRENNYCKFKECGTDGVYRPVQCQKPGVRCATILSDYPSSTFKVLQHEITNLNLLVNILWVGDNLEEIVEKRTVDRKDTLFFHKKPMFLSSIVNFIHVSFPNCEDDSVTICEFEVNQLEKIVWSKIKTNAPYAFHLIRATSFTQADYLDLLKRYNQGRSRGFDIQAVACNWVRDNIYMWDKWIPFDLKNRTTLYIGGIFPISGIYWTQSSVIHAARMAAEAINHNNTLLYNYELKILEQDGHCAADEVMKSFISYVTNDTYKTMVGILGPACSDTVEPIAGVAKHFNTIIISYSAEGALFSNREKYPYFFRTIPENNQFRYVYIKLFQKLGYTRVAALTEDGQKYPEYLSYLQDLMEDQGMTFIVNRKFPRERQSLNMKPYLQDLKAKGAKIIIGDFYDYAARAVMCDAYELGMTAAKGYVWFLPLWFSSDWYDTDLHNSAAAEDYEHITCTTEQMVEAINGHMSLAYKFYTDPEHIMQEGKTVRQWREEYRHVVTTEEKEISRYAGYTYDAVWVYAMALDALFKENNSHVATLHSKKTSRRLVELLNETKFNGVTGPLYFLGSSRISDVIIWQWVNHTSRQIGVYHPDSRSEGVLELNETNIVWLTPNGQKPEDGRQESSSCGVEIIRKILKVKCEVAYVVANMIGVTIFAVIVLISILFYKRRYEKRMKITEKRMKELGLSENSGPFALDEWEMRHDHIVINRKLGEGAFGTVYGGEAYIQNKGWIAVAVKTLKIGAKPEEKLDFLGEAEVMKVFDHVNIVKLVGVCTMGEPVYTVMEFMLYGDLKTYLLSRRNLATEKDRVNNDEVSDRRLTHMALDIARGLSYLAGLKYVHRDLACRNCLVNASRSVKIADFGMCRAMYDSDYYRYNKKGMLPIRWMAPESLIDGIFTPMSDIWSYGIVLYEIVTFASFPYQGMTNDQVLQYLKYYKTLSVPKGCKAKLEDLLMQCWARSPIERPHATEIVEILAHNPELISPCLDMPTASVEVEDTGALELKVRDRLRVHSFSSVWQRRKSAVQLDMSQIEMVESTTQSGHESGGQTKHSGFKFSNKRSLHESFKKIERDAQRERNVDSIPQVTYL